MQHLTVRVQHCSPRERGVHTVLYLVTSSQSLPATNTTRARVSASDGDYAYILEALSYTSVAFPSRSLSSMNVQRLAPIETAQKGHKFDSFEDWPPYVALPVYQNALPRCAPHRPGVVVCMVAVPKSSSGLLRTPCLVAHRVFRARLSSARL